MKRIVKFDLLRIVACFAIVQLHVSNSYWYVESVDGSKFLGLTIYNSFTRFGVPVFFMLSGLFLLDPDREFSVKKWLRKLLGLVAGFYLWSLFYAFQSVLLNGFLHGWDSVSEEMWDNAVERLIMGPSHLWFLLDLFGFYLLIPVLRKVCEDVKVTGYLLLLWVAVRFLLVTVFPGIGGGYVLGLVNAVHLYILTGYIGYFLLGYYLNKTDIPRTARGLLYVFGVGALVFTMVKTLVDCRRTQTYDDHWFNPSNVNILVFSIAVFVWFKYMKVPGWIEESRWVPILTKTTFFVYMIHPFFIAKLNLIGIKVNAYPVVLSVPIMSVGIFAVAVFLGWLAGKIPKIGRIITLQ